MSKVIDLVYCNAGGGHRASAKALATVIGEQHRPWEIRLVNLFELLDPQNIFKKSTGLNPEDFYNKRLARGWTMGLAQELKIFQGLIRMSHEALTRRLRRHWQETKPDMVVSLVPNFNRAMFDGLSIARPRVPYVTILTDFTDYPPNFWIERNQSQHIVCGTPQAVRQAISCGLPRDNIHETSGMIIGPEFYRAIAVDRTSEMRKLGLDPHRLTALVLFGGHGSKIMKCIAADLYDTQLILICGHNAALADTLRKSRANAPRHVVEFTSNVRHFMSMSDLFIGKPGPGSISEAVHQRLPVVVVRNAYTMPQERYNTDWVLENGVGVVLKSFRAIRPAVAQVSSRLPEFQRNIDRIRNRAVFEIPEMMQRILECAGSNHKAGDAEKTVVGAWQSTKLASNSRLQLSQLEFNA